MLLPDDCVTKGANSLPIYNPEKPISWEHAARSAANHIWVMYDFNSQYIFANKQLFIQNNESEINNLRNIIDKYITSDIYLEKISIDEKKDLYHHFSLWMAISHNAISAIKNILHKNIDINEVVDTVIKKQKDYGHKNIAMFAITGLVIRIHDKIARAENILAKENMENAVPGESLYDTFLDMIGYSIIALMWLEGTFMLELENK